MTSETGQVPEGAPPYVGYALARVAHLLNQRMDRRLAELGLSANGFGVLFQVQNDPGVSSAELARRVILTPQSVGPLIAKLEREGLVDREQVGLPGTPILTHITEKGRQRLVEATALVQGVEDELVAGLDPTEQRALRQQLWDMLGWLSPAVAARNRGPS